MIVDIYDVGHGACVVVTAPNGNLLMIDCGRSDDWRPSDHFAGSTIESLVISNYDEDHVRDFENLRRTATVRRIKTNPTVGGGDLRKLKTTDGMGAGIDNLAQWKLSSSASVSSLPDFGEMDRRFYWNEYRKDFDDENNLSIVTVLEWAGFKMILGGDMERAGWQRLLKRADFRNDLRNIDVFMASHHGRESGCCDEIFEICSPTIVVVSDRDRIYQTQDTCGWYGDRARGDVAGRKVYTTRNDQHMRIHVFPDGRWSITPKVQWRKAS
jgi:beta-lactamase superfamily II metal-dependent hydrolase